MSDALSDIARDEERGVKYEEYLESVVSYLQNPNQRLFNKAIKKAASVDCVRRGFFTGETRLSKKAEQVLGNLLSGNKNEWACFLSKNLESLFFNQLKVLSPFKDCALFVVDYGSGFVNIRSENEAPLHGGFEQDFHTTIREKGWKTYDCDKCLACCPLESRISTAEAYWIGCGIYGIKSPRKA